MRELIYDIRNSELAQRTLTQLTGVPESIWEQYSNRQYCYKYTEDLVADVINRYGHFPTSYTDFTFIYFHITTSANRCRSLKTHGILDLKTAYSHKDSELRNFLDQHNIFIDLEHHKLTYMDREYDISYGVCPRRGTIAHDCWAIGRKFYFDYTTCGFLSVWNASPYGGDVHRRPEILMDIGNLLGINLSREWERTHAPYEIVAKVNGEKIVYDGYDENSDEDKVIDYLTRAYLTAFGAPTEEILLIKNNVQIPPSDIIEINPLTYWKNN